MENEARMSHPSEITLSPGFLVVFGLGIAMFGAGYIGGAIVVAGVAYGLAVAILLDTE